MGQPGHVLWEMFAWPQGIVVGNLVASVLWALPALVHLNRKLDRHHRERMDQAERHHRGLLARIAAARPGGHQGSPGEYHGHGEESS